MIGWNQCEMGTTMVPPLLTRMSPDGCHVEMETNNLKEIESLKCTQPLLTSKNVVSMHAYTIL